MLNPNTPILQPCVMLLLYDLRGSGYYVLTFCSHCGTVGVAPVLIQDGGHRLLTMFKADVAFTVSRLDCQLELKLCLGQLCLDWATAANHF